MHYVISTSLGNAALDDQKDDLFISACFLSFCFNPDLDSLSLCPPNATFLSVLVKFPELDRRVCFRRFCFAFWNSCSFHHGGVFLNHVLNLGLVVLCALIFCVIGVWNLPYCLVLSAFPFPAFQSVSFLLTMCGSNVHLVEIFPFVWFYQPSLSQFFNPWVSCWLCVVPTCICLKSSLLFGFYQPSLSHIFYLWVSCWLCVVPTCIWLKSSLLFGFIGLLFPSFSICEFIVDSVWFQRASSLARLGCAFLTWRSLSIIG